MDGAPPLGAASPAFLAQVRREVEAALREALDESQERLVALLEERLLEREVLRTARPSPRDLGSARPPLISYARASEAQASRRLGAWTRRKLPPKPGDWGGSRRASADVTTGKTTTSVLEGRRGGGAPPERSYGSEEARPRPESEGTSVVHPVASEASERPQSWEGSAAAGDAASSSDGGPEPEDFLEGMARAASGNRRRSTTIQVEDAPPPPPGPKLGAAPLPGVPQLEGPPPTLMSTALAAAERPPPPPKVVEEPAEDLDLAHPHQRSRRAVRDVSCRDAPERRPSSRRFWKGRTLASLKSRKSSMLSAWRSSGAESALQAVNRRASLVSEGFVRLRPETLKETFGKHWFEQVVLLALIGSAVVTGVEVDMGVRRAPGHDSPLFFYAEVLFFAVFLLELAWRWRESGTRDFFAGSDWQLNCFDAAMVLGQGADIAITCAQGSAPTSASVSTMRFLRFWRIFRITRLVRILRWVQELNKIVFLIKGSLWPFFWAFLLMSLATYLLATICTQLVVDSASADASLSQYFGQGLGESVLVLFASTSGGIEWLGLVKAVGRKFTPFMGLVVCAYIMFVILVIMNLVTGVFVESAKRQMKVGEDQELVEKMMAIFKMSDLDGDIALTAEEFFVMMQTPHIREAFFTIDLEPEKAQRLFLILDRDGSGSLSPQEFVEGALKLRGWARAFDVEAMRHEVWTSSQEVLNELRRVNHRLAKWYRANQAATARALTAPQL